MRVSTDHSSDTACPFCNDTIRSHVFHETDNFLAIYNRAPILPGHSLIIPRKHCSSLHDLHEAMLGQFFIYARFITKALIDAFDASGFDWSLQEGDAAGQTVNHLHLHIIPRSSGDLPEPGRWYQALFGSQHQSPDSNLRDIIGNDDLKVTIHKIRNYL